MRGGGEVEGHPPGLEAHQEDLDTRIGGEGGDHPVPLLHAHAAFQPHALDPHLRNGDGVSTAVLPFAEVFRDVDWSFVRLQYALDKQVGNTQDKSSH